MGIYNDGNIYGVYWVDEENNNEYEKTYSKVLTEEQRQEIYDDFIRFIPEDKRSLYRFRVYTRSYTTYEPVEELSFCFMWWPLEVKYLLEYFEKGKIVGF